MPSLIPRSGGTSDNVIVVRQESRFEDENDNGFTDVSNYLLWDSEIRSSWFKRATNIYVQVISSLLTACLYSV